MSINEFIAESWQEVESVFSASAPRAVGPKAELMVYLSGRSSAVVCKSVQL